MTDPKVELQAIISDRVNSLLDQCEFYVRAAHNRGLGYQLASLGLTTTVGFLALVYVRAIGKTEEATRRGTISDRIAFRILIMDYPRIITGYVSDFAQPEVSTTPKRPTPKELETLWDSWRNKLSHLGMSRGGTTPSLPSDDSIAKEQLENPRGEMAFHFYADGTWRGYVDILVPEVRELSRWVLDQVTKANETTIGAIHTWLDDQYRI